MPNRVVPLVPSMALAVTKEKVPWVTDKVHREVCRGGGDVSYEIDFNQKADNWCAKVDSNGEQVYISMWCKPCKTRRRNTRYAMVICDGRQRGGAPDACTVELA